jgi:hypothetical protein
MFGWRWRGHLLGMVDAATEWAEILRQGGRLYADTPESTRTTTWSVVELAFRLSNAGLRRRLCRLAPVLADMAISF